MADGKNRWSEHAATAVILVDAGMKFLQARNPDWACRTFLAKYDENAVWLDDLKPAFGGEKFFFENDPAPAASRRN